MSRKQVFVQAGMRVKKTRPTRVKVSSCGKGLSHRQRYSTGPSNPSTFCRDQTAIGNGAAVDGRAISHGARLADYHWAPPSVSCTGMCSLTVSYTHLRAHETPEH